MLERLAILGLAVGLTACGDDLTLPEERAPSVFVDQDPEPGTTEIHLVATPSTTEYLEGKKTAIWAFRDGRGDRPATIPGPLLEVERGQHVIVHFTNELPEATTIHWHGLRVPNAFDGTPANQVPVEPGATFDYVFDATDAGLFWYHPHVASDVQIERGLYGPIVVRGDIEPEVAVERVLMLDDVKLEASGALSTDTDPLDVMLGRQGNVLLVDGQKDATVDAAAGSRERWRLVNTANGRFFNLELPGRDLLVIGWDGGVLAEPYAVPNLLIAPGERYDVLVDLAGSPGDDLALRTIHYDRGHQIPDPGPKTILTLRLGSTSEAPATLPTTWGTFEPIVIGPDTSVRELVLSEEEGVGDPSFYINGERFPDVTPAVADLDTTEIWSVRNDAEMDHPFHLHGMFFQVLDVDGVPVERQGWKDTVNIPQRATLRFAVRLDAPGMWMYHCHILEHAERGMMGELHVGHP